jgi:F420-dependent methylenetetrahydromethanopterin dehydrogenase
MTALTVALDCGNVDVAKLLIKAGANVNIVDDDAQETALNVAVEQGYIYIVKLLIKRNVNLYYEKYDEKYEKYDGVTALDIAIENSESQYNIKIIKLLLNALMYA